MKINLRSDAHKRSGTAEEMLRQINRIAQGISIEHSVNPQKGAMFLMTDPTGQEILFKNLKDEYDINVKHWRWGTENEIIAEGYDFEETASLTHFILQCSDKKAA